MGKNANFISHKKSKLKENGGPKLPLASDLVEGEIAINFAKNVETLSIKNESGDVVTFSSDNYYTEKKLGSGFTGENSGVTVTEALENIEITVDQVIDSGTSASTDAVSTSAVYGFVTSYTPSITVDQDFSNTASTNPISTKAVYSAITDNELVWTNAYVTLSGTVSAHTENTEIHVTAADKEKLHTHSNKASLDSITGNVGTMAYQNANSYSSATEVNTALGNKANTSDLNDFFDDAKYEDSGTTKVINFYHGNTIKATIDASDFVVDGMVDDVRIENGNLVIDFNTASGKQDISIPLTDIFDPSNYYDKDDIDGLVGSGFTSSSITDVIIENEEIVSAALTDLDERKLDASAYTPSVGLWESGTGLNSVAQKGGGNTASGKFSVAIGSGTTASGDFSHAEGKDTSATTNFSHTEGQFTLAVGGAGEHAEGYYSSAITNYSHAEGQYTYSVDNSHTEGYKTSGTVNSHAEGGYTIASNYSHTEGYQTTGNTYSHAEGYQTSAYSYSHAEGYVTKARLYSHAEGYQTSATSSNSHSEGLSTIASGMSSHAEGSYTKAIGENSHAEGYETVANGNKSHTEGQGTIASGESSHAEGYRTSATTYQAHAEGYETLASGNYSHAEGWGSKAIKGYSHAEGRYTEAKNPSEHASGQFNISLSASTDFGDSGNTLFSVGNGTADDARHNAFEVRQNGDIYIVNKNGQDVKLQDEIGNITIDQVIDSSTSASTNAVSTKAVYDYISDIEYVVSTALNDLETNKLDASAYTPTDLSNYYTKSETSGATEISNALGAKSDTGHTHEASGVTAMTGYQMAASSASVLTTDTLLQVIGKLEKRISLLEASVADLNSQSETVATALVELHSEIGDIETLLSQI